MFVGTVKSVVLMLLMACAVMTGFSEEPVFSIGDKADSQVKWRGNNLIGNDSLSFFEGKSFVDKAQQTKAEKKDKWEKVVNTWSTDASLPFRKELAVSSDGKEVELNIRADMPSYSQKKEPGSFGYSFRIPMTLVKGMKCSGITGRSTSPVNVTDAIDGKKRKIFGGSARYFALEGNGKSLVIDFNPEGVQTYGDFGPGSIIGVWSIDQTPEYLECGIGIKNTEYGGVFSGKVRIFEGGMDDYLKRHAYGKYSYFSELPLEKQFCFGAKKHGKEFTDAGLSEYSASSGFGWLDPKDMKIVENQSSGSVFSAATGNGDKIFRCDLPRPGLYVFTLRCAGYEKPQGAFSIAANGKNIVDNLTIEANTLKNISWSQWVDDGKLELAFKGGNFTVSVLGAQLLQHGCEDFKFRRGFWVADGYEPHPVNTNADFDVPPEYEIAVSSISLPEKPVLELVETPVVPEGDTCLPDQAAPEMAWRYNAIIGSLGPGNGGTFTEFATTGLIERRLQQIKEQNINCILINGLLSRHTFPEQHQRVQDNIKEVATAGHKLGMKILDHQDLSLLWNVGSAFRVMTQKLGMTQRTIDGNFPTRGFCLTNKKFSEEYFKWIVDFIRTTDIDGIMIDEACYHGATFCGCIDCRRKFTADTGLTLPFDETSPILYNRNSKLWKAWLTWRMKAVGDFDVELRRRVMPFKPYFTIMKYTTHGGYVAGYAFVGNGSSLSDAARGCDFLGTEIMSRNVMASYRSVFALRKAKNALREAFNSPIFGLVYPLESVDLAYFGWGMNNMNGQVTWTISGHKDNNTPFISFKENMDLRLARPVADIAVLFPTQSINWAQYMAVAPDVIGTSEAMNNRHIMHDFFMERSLNLDYLTKYRVVMLNCSCCLSDAQMEVLFAYVKQGGTLYMTATTGLLDEMGNERKDWLVAKMLGIALYGKKVGFLPKPLIRYLGQDPIQYNSSVMRIELDRNNPPDVLAEVVDASGKVIQPLAVEKKYGKGRFIYSAAALGAANYETEISYMNKWIFVIDKNVDAFNEKMLNLVIGKPELQFTPVQFPERVLASVYRQEVDGKTSTLVHLLNAGGSPVALGEVVPAVPPLTPAWPVLTQDIIFDIALPGLKDAYTVSPDWQGRKKVSFQALSDKRWRVTVPKDMLKCYSIVYLEQ
jgi:hypothetical protein